jgi:hypothetical protein
MERPGVAREPIWHTPEPAARKILLCHTRIVDAEISEFSMQVTGRKNQHGQSKQYEGIA